MISVTKTLSDLLLECFGEQVAITSSQQGQVTMVNALGAGVLETQALMAFLPAISRHLTGQPLTLPNVATWWCGQAPQLAYVRSNAHRMTIGPAMATRLPFEDEHAPGVARLAGGGAIRVGANLPFFS